MRYYPVNLDILNKPCLVIGGGSVGTRKALALIECGAVVTVVSPVVTKKLLEASAGNGHITLKNRTFKPSDLNKMFLVIGATNNEVLNRQIYNESKRLGMLCNIADRPEACNFILPAVVKRDDLSIAISTSGQSPAFAKKLRKDLEKQFGEEYGRFLRLMGGIRKKLLSKEHKPEAHKRLFEQIINKDLLKLFKEERYEEIDSILFEILGAGYETSLLLKAGR